MKVIIPKYLLGKPIEGSLERALADAPQADPQNQLPPQNPPSPASNGGILNLQDCIILPGQNRGMYTYPDLIVAKHRLGYDAQVERVAKELGIQVQNTAEEKDGTKYIGNMNWETALKLNAKLGNTALTIRQYVDFLELLKNGIDRKIKVFDGTGREVRTNEVTEIYNELREVRSPWRSEWLDNSFFKISDTQVGMRYEHGISPTGTLIPRVVSVPLETHITEDCWVDESSFNAQGLPTRKSNAQTLYHWYPQAGAVARFYADSDRTRLGCYWNPTYTSSSLGVRPARAKN